MTAGLPLASTEATGLPEAAITAIRQVLASHPEVEAAILELLALGEFLEDEKANWLAAPSSSNGPAPVDDGTNSALVALIMRLAEAQDVALGWLNEQTVSMTDGPAQSAWKAVVADALSAVHAARSEGTATVVEVGEVDGIVNCEL